MRAASARWSALTFAMRARARASAQHLCVLRAEVDSTANSAVHTKLARSNTTGYNPAALFCAPCHRFGGIDDNGVLSCGHATACVHNRLVRPSCRRSFRVGLGRRPSRAACRAESHDSRRALRVRTAPVVALVTRRAHRSPSISSTVQPRGANVRAPRTGDMKNTLRRRQ